jgi:hypothetical protein
MTAQNTTKPDRAAVPAARKGSSEAKGTGPDANKPSNPTTEANKQGGKK